MRSYTLLYSVVLLTGCSTNESFDCKAGTGIGCKSITQVNQFVDRGDFDEDLSPSGQSLIAFSEDRVVQRVQEQHLRVWIAPFQDEHGNFHEDSTVHTVIKPGYWTVREGM